MRILFKFLGSSDVKDRNAHLVKPVGEHRKMTKNLSFIVVRDRNQLIFDGSFHSFPIFRRSTSSRRSYSGSSQEVADVADVADVAKTSSANAGIAETGGTRVALRHGTWGTWG
jgi:hypothetical protein